MDNKVIQQTMKEIMDKVSTLEESKDIASAILNSDDIRDDNDRFTVINALAHRLLDISKEATSIWVRAHNVWSEAKAEEIANEPAKELAELEEGATDDLPFC